MPVVSFSEASRCTGISRVQLSRMAERGDLADFLRGRNGSVRLVELTGLLEHCKGACRLRADSRWQGMKREPVQQPATDWPAVAEWCNALLSPGDWGPPPWPADRWATLSVVLEVAGDLVAQGTQCTPETLAAMEDD